MTIPSITIPQIAAAKLQINSRLVLAGNRIGHPMFGNTDFQNPNNYLQFQQMIAVQFTEDIANPEFDFGNFNRASVGSSALTLKVGIGTSQASARTAGLWASNGQKNVTLSPGAVDTVRFTGSFSKGSKIYLCYFGQYASAAGWVCSGYTSSLDYNEIGNSLTDKTELTGGWLATRQVPDTILRPIAMRGYVNGVFSSTAFVNILGDSISSGGVGDTVGSVVNGQSYSGWANRALAELGCAFTNNGYQGLTIGTVVNETGTNRTIREAAIYNPLNGLKIGLIPLGTNDLSSTTTGALYTLLQNNIQTLVARNTAAGLKTIVCTAPPRTNTGNTASSVPYRLQYNDWVRSTFGALVFDVAAFCQDATDNTLWRTDLGTPTTDGVHPAGVIHTAIKDGFKAAFPSLLAA